MVALQPRVPTPTCRLPDRPSTIDLAGRVGIQARTASSGSGAQEVPSYRHQLALRRGGRSLSPTDSQGGSPRRALEPSASRGDPMGWSARAQVSDPMSDARPYCRSNEPGPQAGTPAQMDPSGRNEDRLAGQLRRLAGPNCGAPARVSLNPSDLPCILERSVRSRYLCR